MPTTKKTAKKAASKKATKKKPAAKKKAAKKPAAKKKAAKKKTAKKKPTAASMENLDRWEKVFVMKFASVYPMYVQKVEKKGRTTKELDQVICWLTGYTQRKLTSLKKSKTVDLRGFFEGATMNPNAPLITGVICGHRVETIKHPLIRDVRYLDKLVDELAAGRKMEKILRE